MARQATIYPYELLDLLEELQRVRFSGTLTLHAGGATTLYVNAGTVRYARTTRVMGAFPAYLLYQRVFSRDLLKRALAACTDEGLTLERYLMRERVLSPEDLRHLKCDLARDIFAHALCASGTVEIQPVTRLSSEYKQPVLDPYEALFTCAAEHPARPVIAAAFEGCGHRRLARGPETFALLPSFRAVFGRSPVLALLGDAPTVDAVFEALADEDAREDDGLTPADVQAQLFALLRAGMANLDGDPPRRAVLRPRPEPEAAEREPAPAAVPAAADDDDPELLWRSRTPTRPGVPVRACGDEALLARSPGLPASPPRPSLEPAASPVARATAFAAHAERTPTGGDVGLRDILVGESLIATADQAQQQDRHAFFGLRPDAPLSALRAAYRRAWSQYAAERFEGFALSTEAAAALVRVQEHIERAYDTLTDPALRVEHDRVWDVHGPDAAAIEAMFEAEACFEEGRARLEAREAPEAVALLGRAAALCLAEPEYPAWQAWALVCASLWRQEVPDAPADPHVLLERALALDGELPSAWMFIARIAELAGDGEAAARAWRRVVAAEPGHPEATEALGRLGAGGAATPDDEPATLVDRLDRILDPVR